MPAMSTRVRPEHSIQRLVRWFEPGDLARTKPLCSIAPDPAVPLMTLSAIDSCQPRTASAKISSFFSKVSDPPTVKKSIAEAELDFSAIAKGYAVDEIGRLLEGVEILDYLVEIGGEIRARGQHRQSSS